LPSLARLPIAGGCTPQQRSKNKALEIAPPAHAVVATALAINNDLIKRGGYRDFRSSVLDKICVALAGPEAETMAFGDADASDGDQRMIEQLCARYYIIDGDVERLRPQVRTLLIRYWHLVERVAEALLRQRTLTAAEIDPCDGGNSYHLLAARPSHGRLRRVRSNRGRFQGLESRRNRRHAA
jgi:hypothetical protein